MMSFIRAVQVDFCSRSKIIQKTGQFLKYFKLGQKRTKDFEFTRETVSQKMI